MISQRIIRGVADYTYTYAQSSVNPFGGVGPQGDTGAQGPQGVQGAAGANGNNGTEGPQGFQGATGATGPQGFQGATGATGTNGTTGPQGFQGATGETGATGPQGDIGATGAQGPQGFQGATGATGATGSQGPQGATGAQGAAGTTNIETIYTLNSDLTNNTTTFSTATDLSPTGLPAGTYFIHCQLMFDTTATADIKVLIGGTGIGAVTNGVILSTSSASSTVNANNRFDTQWTILTTSTGRIVVDARGFVQPTASFNLEVRWAQNTAVSGTPSTFLKGSVIKMIRTA